MFAHINIAMLNNVGPDPCQPRKTLFTEHILEGFLGHDPGTFMRSPVSPHGRDEKIMQPMVDHC